MSLTKLPQSNEQKELAQKVAEISGENIFSCYQCGRCSAGCPMVWQMDILPNQVFMLLQHGEVQPLLESQTIWTCAACFQCTVRCPKGIDLAAVMEALRQLTLRKNENYVRPEQIAEKEYEKLPPIALVSNFRKFTP